MEGGERRLWKMFEILRHDYVAALDDGSREHVPIIGIGKREEPESVVHSR